MKRFLWGGSVICSIIFLSACQFFQNFIIVNNSNEEIEIQYRLKDSAFKGGQKGFTPETTSLSNLNAWRFFQKDWENMPAEQYTFDETERTYKVKIKPYQVAKIGWADSYFLEKDSDGYFTVRNLKIKGNNKEINFEDSNKLLTELKKNDYQIIYK